MLSVLKKGEVLMPLDRIFIEGFRSIREQWLPADGLVVLFGPNSAGKTSVLEAAVELLGAASSRRIDPGENRELVELYRKALHVTFPVAMADDTVRSGAGPFGDVTVVPVTVVLDRVGRVVARVAGRVAKSEELRAALAGL